MMRFSAHKLMSPPFFCIGFSWKSGPIIDLKRSRFWGVASAFGVLGFSRHAIWERKSSFFVRVHFFLYITLLSRYIPLVNAWVVYLIVNGVLETRTQIYIRCFGNDKLCWPWSMVWS